MHAVSFQADSLVRIYFRENFGGYFFNNLDQSTLQWPIVVTCLTLRCHEGGLFHANSSYMYLDLMLILTN